MAHWAEIDENNIVTQVIVTSNEEADEGYSWIIENLGGRWIKTSYNTAFGKHLSGGTPLRAHYAGIGYEYLEDLDIFMPPRPFQSWKVNTEKYEWEAPIPRPDSGLWIWDETTVSWKEHEVE